MRILAWIVARPEAAPRDGWPRPAGGMGFRSGNRVARTAVLQCRPRPRRPAPEGLRSPHAGAHIPPGAGGAKRRFLYRRIWNVVVLQQYLESSSNRARTRSKRCSNLCLVFVWYPYSLLHLTSNQRVGTHVPMVTLTVLVVVLRQHSKSSYRSTGFSAHAYHGAGPKRVRGPMWYQCASDFLPAINHLVLMGGWGPWPRLLL